MGEKKKQLFDEIVAGYAPKLANWAVRRLESIEDAEDLCQEVMFRLYNVLSRSDDEHTIREMDKYLWAIAYESRILFARQ